MNTQSTLLNKRSLPQLSTVALADTDVYDDGYLRVEYDHYYVSCGGQYIPLMRKEFLIIAHLVRNCDRFVSSIEIWQSVWQKPAPPNLNTLKVHLHRVRQRLARFHVQIETKPSTGYRLISGPPSSLE
jgi:two-component system OmpR family response regulator